MSPWLRRALLVALDGLVLLAAGAVTLFLRWDGGGAAPGGPFPPGGLSTPVALLGSDPLASRIPLGALLFVSLFAAFGLYRRLWEYASVRDLLTLLYACASTGLVLLTVVDIPPGLRALYWLLATGATVAVRLAFRARRESASLPSSAFTSAPPAARRVLIVGAGEAGVELARELVRHPELGLQPVAFVDDSRGKLGQEAHGLRVAGPCRDLGRVARELAAQEVAIAMPTAPGPVVRTILTQAAGEGLSVRILPSLRDRSPRALAGQLRDVQVADLLGRPEVRLDLRTAGSYLAGRAVLVTGAGGSIGSELCRQVARVRPGALVLFGHGENSIYNVLSELRESHPRLDVHPVVGSIQDPLRVRTVMETWRPAVVFHAAAHKHVPLMEQNPSEAVANNVLGTYHVARAAHLAGAERFVLISTDKAVHPASIMGATKRVAETIVQHLAATSATVFVAVRFGNVLGSRGSVVPLFQRQIARGGPITITHPDTTRYFMTIPEAVSLVIQAAAMGCGGDVFVLDMGEAVRIVDLARDLIRLAGLDPDSAIPIQFTGLRPGEKLTEELYGDLESVSATVHPRIHRIRREPRATPPPGDLTATLARCRDLGQSSALGRDEILHLLSAAWQGGEMAHESGRSPEERH